MTSRTGESDSSESSAERSHVSEDDKRTLSGSGTGTHNSSSEAPEDASFLASAQNSPHSDMRNHEAYLKLFRETHEEQNYVDTSYLDDTQIGAVVWTALEKANFFFALQRKGRHDLPAIAQNIGSKSELEVRDYLILIQDTEKNRQLFLSHPKNVSKAKLSAAIEIGNECEEQLDEAANGLLTLQNEYDRAYQQAQHPNKWLITHEVAARLDQETDLWVEQTHNQTEATEDDHPMIDRSTTLFNLSKALELSEKIFMNCSSSCEHDHWHDLAQPSQKPEITVDALDELHDIVVNLTRRLVQTIIFLTKSRIKQTTLNKRPPHATVHREDVEAAFAVLNFRHDLWEYWVHLPRRCQLHVFSDKHRKGEGVRKPLSYSQVESALEVKNVRGRRRAPSSLSGSSSMTDFSTDDAVSETSSIATSSRVESENNDHDSESSNSLGSPALRDFANDHESLDMESEASLSSASLSGVKDKRRMSRLERQHKLEEDIEVYMEEMDQQTRREEEQRLSAVLHDEVLSESGQGSRTKSRLPKRLRKEMDEVSTWKVDYKAEWEQFGGVLPGSEFQNTDQQRKKRRDV